MQTPLRNNKCLCKISSRKECPLWHLFSSWILRNKDKAMISQILQWMSSDSTSMSFIRILLWSQRRKLTRMLRPGAAMSAWIMWARIWTNAMFVALALMPLSPNKCRCYRKKRVRPRLPLRFQLRTDKKTRSLNSSQWLLRWTPRSSSKM